MSLPYPLCSTRSATGGTDLVRKLAQWALEQLIDPEAAEKIDADRWERTPGRVTYRNGNRPKVPSTKAGDLALAIPKLRKGSFWGWRGLVDGCMLG